MQGGRAEGQRLCALGGHLCSETCLKVFVGVLHGKVSGTRVKTGSGARKKISKVLRVEGGVGCSPCGFALGRLLLGHGQVSSKTLWVT